MIGSDFYAYYLRKGFKRTDKSTEFYEAVTDAVEIMRRRFGFDGDDEEKTTTDTISSLGDFKISVESDFGIIKGIIMEDSEDAHPLIKTSKKEFDELYPDINVTSDQGYPKHYCIYNSSIYIGPIPQSTSYSYRITYSKKGETISSATDPVPFSEEHRDLLALLVDALMYSMMGDYQKGEFKEQKWREEFEIAVRRERINSGDSFFTVRQTDY